MNANAVYRTVTIEKLTMDTCYRNLVQMQDWDVMVSSNTSTNCGVGHGGEDEKRHEDASSREEGDRGKIPQPQAWKGDQDGYHGQELRRRQMSPARVQSEPGEDVG